MPYLRMSAGALLAATLGATALAGRYHVDASAPDGGDGSSWASAFDTLQEALAVAGSGDEIWVAQGTYLGGFAVPGGVDVYGGFMTGASTRTQRDPAAHATVLDGQSQRRVLDGLGDGSVLDGFVVRNGRAGGLGGGGALIDGTDPIIRNCTFTGNANTAGRGSTMHIINGANPTVENTYVVRNLDESSGHVIDVEGSGGLYRNIVVYDNHHNGFHFQNNASPRIVNSIFANNSGRGICDITADDQPVFENNLVVNNAVSLYHYHGQELTTIAEVNALPYARGNISADPAFVDAAGGDYRLQSGSPCIEAGTVAFGSTTTDLFSNSRRLDGNLDGRIAIDIGAHEFAHAALAVVGPPARGSSVQVQVAGNPTLFAVLLVGADLTDGVLAPPYGYLLVNFAQPFLIAPIGTLPATVDLAIPADIPVGTRFVLQSVAVQSGLGNTTNAADVTVQ